MSYLVVQPTLAPVSGVISVPCSKYHLHRALIFGSLAEGTTTVYGRSEAKHIHDTLNALYDLGATVQDTSFGYRVRGGQFLPRSSNIRLGSSGSTTQFLLGLGSQATHPVVFDGAQALRNRPIGPLLEALNRIGIQTKSMAGRLPVTVFPSNVQGGSVEIAGTLSQWISGLMIVAPFAQSDTQIHVLDPYNERTYVHLTLSMLRDFGISVEADAEERCLTIPKQQTYKPADVYLDADFSSAAFPLVYGALHEGEVTLTHIKGAGRHPEGAIVDILLKMGVDLDIREEEGRIVLRNPGTRPLGTDIDMAHIPDLIPILSVLGSLAHGRTVLRNIGPGRFKESNRVLAMQQLRKMGARIEEDNDDLVIEGVPRLHGADIDVFDDHRVQMAFAVAGSLAEGETYLNFPQAYEISYPEFISHMSQLSMRVQVTEKVPLKELNSSGSR